MRNWQIYKYKNGNRNNGKTSNRKRVLFVCFNSFILLLSVIHFTLLFLHHTPIILLWIVSSDINSKKLQRQFFFASLFVLCPCYGLLLLLIFLVVALPSTSSCRTVSSCVIPSWCRLPEGDFVVLLVGTYLRRMNTITSIMNIPTISIQVLTVASQLNVNDYLKKCIWTTSAEVAKER